MATQLLLSHRLKNGLTLVCMDESKKIAADRWHVCIRVQVTIPVEKKWFVNPPVNEEDFQQITSVLGSDILFEQKKERNFVSADRKEQIVIDICDSVVEMGDKYVNHIDFAAKYILKVFADPQR